MRSKGSVIGYLGIPWNGLPEPCRPRLCLTFGSQCGSWYRISGLGWVPPGIDFGALMDSGEAKAARLLSRRRLGRAETILLSLAAVVLTLGGVAWPADLGDSGSLVTAALPPAN